MAPEPLTALGIIPARKGSQRYPDKHHALLLGKPMFAYTVDAALESRRFNKIVISTDDLRLKPLADRYGVEFMERPAELASSTSALDDAVRHICRLLEARDGFRPDVILSMQGNVPVRKPGQIDEVIRRFEEMPQATAICTAQMTPQRPEWAQVMKHPATGEARPYMPGPKRFRVQDFPELFIMDGAILGVRRETLFEQEKNNKVAFGWCGPRLHLIPQDHPMYSIEVDYPHQRALAEFYLLYQKCGDGWLQELTAPLGDRVRAS